MPPRRRKPPRAGALTDLPPRKIVRSILLLQLAYYLIAAVLILFTAVVAGQRFSLALVFDWRTVRGDNTLGWLLGVVWLSVSLFAVIVLLFLINRSKLVPDFAFTLHFLHLVTTSFYARTVPTNLLWWALQAASAGIMVGLGVWACRYRELKPISFGTIGATTAGASASASASATQQPGAGTEGEEGEIDDDDKEHVRGGSGRGRGRNRGDGPSYEMVALKEQQENGDAV